MIHFNSSNFIPPISVPHRRQIGLGGEIAVARFAKGLGQCFSYDNLGIQSPRNDKVQEFEAGWTAAGAGPRASRAGQGKRDARRHRGAQPAAREARRRCLHRGVCPRRQGRPIRSLAAMK
jgi:hypothetical protein